MTKFIYFCIILLWYNTAFAQVGIGTENPTETLDVDGTVRIRDINYLPGNLSSAKDSIVVFNTDGVLKFVSSNMIVATADSNAFPNNESFTSATIDPVPADGNMVGDVYQNSAEDTWWYFDGSSWLPISSGNTVPDGSETKVQGAGISVVSGSGTIADPYVVTTTELDGSPTNEIQSIFSNNTPGNIAISGANVITLNVDDADADSTNEIQTISLTGNDLSLSQNGGSVTIPTADGSETRVQGGGINTVTGSGTTADPYIVTATETDGSITNEIQTLSLTGNNLSLSQNGGNVTIPTADGSETKVSGAGINSVTGSGTTADPYIVTATEVDGSITNEIQSLTSTDGSVSLTKAGNDYDLSVPVATPADGSETKVQGAGINAVTGSGTTADPYIVTATELDGSPTNEIQSIYSNNTPGNIAISGANVITLNVDDADANATNEIQTLSLTGNNLTLSQNGGSVTIPTSDGSETKVSGAGINSVTGSGTTADPYVITATEVDGSTTNEIQTLSLTGNSLSLSQNGGSVTIPTSDGSETKVSGAGINSVTGSGTTADPYIVTAIEVDGSTTNEIQTITSTDGSVSLTKTGNDYDLSVSGASADGSETKVTGGGINTVTGSGTTASPYVVTATEVDGSTTNEIQTLSITGGQLSLSNGGGTAYIPDAWYDIATGVPATSVYQDIWHKGNVAINTGNASTELHVGADSEYSGTIFWLEADALNTNAAENPQIRLTQAGNTVQGKIGITGYATSYFDESLESATYIDAKGTSHAIQFSTGGTATTRGTARMTITRTGNIGIGTSVPLAKIDALKEPRTGIHNNANAKYYFTGDFGFINNGAEFVKSDATAGIGIASNGIYSVGSTGTNNMYLRGQNYVVIQPGNGAYSIEFSQASIRPALNNTTDLGTATYRFKDVYATNGTIQTSDERLKKNIKDSHYGLADVMKLRPVIYDWKDNTGTDKVGFIAQELKKVVPNVVVGDVNESFLGVNYAELVPVLTKAIQEQENVIQDQQKQIDELKNAIHEIHEKLMDL